MTGSKALVSDQNTRSSAITEGLRCAILVNSCYISRGMGGRKVSNSKSDLQGNALISPNLKRSHNTPHLAFGGNISCTPLHGPVQFAIYKVLQLSGTFSPKTAPSPLGLVTPTVPRAKTTHHPKWHPSRFSRFCMGPKCYAVQCFVNGEENPKKLPLPLGFCHPARGGLGHRHRKHAQKSW